jgi:hypothetical protein
MTPRTGALRVDFMRAAIKPQRAQRAQSISAGGKGYSTIIKWFGAFGKAYAT